MNKNNRKEKKDNLNILKFIGPGLLVTVGFIDPGNWASNIAARFSSIVEGRNRHFC